ncbi:Transmembrane protein [Trichinella nativa]|uniref:Transmembrane protein n=1 Tax=Trichinella nativa TaxID=6335 RepID=A0A0V1KRJ9_9BILA|nr:Transmembrane protein [Trichinella nativa]
MHLIHFKPKVQENINAKVMEPPAFFTEICQLFLARPAFHIVTFLAVIFGYISSFSPFLFEELALVVHHLLYDGKIWTLFTFWMLESNVLMVFLDFLLLNIAFRVFEPIWGMKHLWLFFWIVNLSVAVVLSLFIMIVYAAFGSIVTQFQILIDMRTFINGLSGFNGAVVYTLAHTFPNTPLYHSRLLHLQLKHLPVISGLVYFALSLFKALFHLRTTIFGEQYFCMYIVGVGAGWLFFQYFEKKTSLLKGQSNSASTYSNSMSALFSRWFPSSAQVSEMDDLVGVQVHSTPSVIPGITPLDAERYRQKAIRDLTERLEKARQSHAESQPRLAVENTPTQTSNAEATVEQQRSENSEKKQIDSKTSPQPLT